jgi:hypothetical protein
MDRDVLISRVVDGLASETDWRELDRVGETDSSVWRELAAAQRQQSLLSTQVRLVAESAGRVDLPDTTPAVIKFPGSTWRWSGWAAAAAVGLMWITGVRPADRTIGDPRAGETNIAGLGNPLAGVMPVGDSTPQEYLDRYISKGSQQGWIVGQIENKPVVELRPVIVEGGKTAYDVVYARVILERTRLPDVYRLTTDEFGGQMTVRTELPTTVSRRAPM